jgi:carboxymethylenebutenolidase
MSEFSRERPQEISRREWLKVAATAAVMCVLDCNDGEAQVVDHQVKRALDDPRVSHDLIEFQGGDALIGGYLAHPKKEGSFPAVVVITGSSIRDEYVQNMTAMLAQAGFVGFAPDIFALQKPEMPLEEKRRIFVEQITDERIFADLDAAAAYLAKQPFVRGQKIGTTGFCFGGRCALMYATRNANVAAVVPFYGNLKTPEFAKRTTDPVDVVDRIHAAVQGHYSKDDDEIPLPQLSQFESDLNRNHTEAKFYTYDAPHGFFAYGRSTYNDAAARKSWKRAVEFFHKHLR